LITSKEVNRQGNVAKLEASKQDIKQRCGWWKDEGRMREEEGRMAAYVGRGVRRSLTSERRQNIETGGYITWLKLNSCAGHVAFHLLPNLFIHSIFDLIQGVGISSGAIIINVSFFHTE